MRGVCGKEMESSSKYYAMGLRLGILSAEDIQLWVNSEIAKTPNPSEAFIQLAFSTSASTQDIYSILSSLNDSSDDFDVLRRLLSRINEKDLEDINFCHRLAECLYGIWVDNDYLAPEDLNLIGFLDDEYDLASQGIYGTLERWHNDFKSFVQKFR